MPDTIAYASSMAHCAAMGLLDALNAGLLAGNVGDAQD